MTLKQLKILRVISSLCVLILIYLTYGFLFDLFNLPASSLFKYYLVIMFGGILTPLAIFTFFRPYAFLFLILGFFPTFLLIPLTFAGRFLESPLYFSLLTIAVSNFFVLFKYFPKFKIKKAKLRGATNNRGRR